MGMMAAVLSGFILALAAPWLYRLAGNRTGWLLALLPLGLTYYFGSHAGAIAAGEAVHVTYSWVPSLGVNLSLHLDGLSLLMALLITGIGALVLVYSGGYLGGRSQLGRLYAYLLMFMGSMLGLVLADNLLVLFVFWELTSLSSYLLIGFDHEREQARSAALQALLVTGGGGLALLAGLLLLGEAGRSLELSMLMTRAGELKSSPSYAPALLLILLGAFTKSAQFPFHFWLPGAMEAPTPVSAYLHSATMVKAGVYLLARLSPALGGTEIWLWSVTACGAATMLVGGWLALVQTDLKRILAYSTISALGMLVMLLGIGEKLAVTAAMAFLLGHALYKGALFLATGALEHETGTRDASQMRGLFRAMPITAVASAIAALSMAGLPPMLGFIAKELTYESTLHAPAAAWLTTVTVLASVSFVALAGLVGFRLFLGKAIPTPKEAHEAPPSLWLGVAILALLGLLSALWPQGGVELLIAAASTAVLGQPTEIHLALWHGLSPAVVLSVVTLASGVVVYGLLDRLRSLARRWEDIARWGPAASYDRALSWLNRLALEQTRVLQSGYLRYYLLIILLTTVGLVGSTLAIRGSAVGLPEWSEVRFYDVGLVALILMATVVTVVVGPRLAAIATLGVVGYSVALVFVLFGAPDVAVTQFLIETLTVILFVLVFYHLPEPREKSSTLGRIRDAMVALAVGALVTVLALIAAGIQYHPTISGFYSEQSVPAAHGRNVVNVILVDYRGLDTLGEITVLAVAGIGVYALLKLRLGGRGARRIGMEGEEGRPVGGGRSDADGASRTAPEAGSDGESRDRAAQASGGKEGGHQ